MPEGDGAAMRVLAAAAGARGRLGDESLPNMRSLWSPQPRRSRRNRVLIFPSFLNKWPTASANCLHDTVINDHGLYGRVWVGTALIVQCHYANREVQITKTLMRNTNR
jgi:hypothetical protein